MASVHDTSVILLSTMNGFNRKAYRKTVSKKLKEMSYLSAAEIVGTTNIIPDGWRIAESPVCPLPSDQENRKGETWLWLSVLEVEDTNPISESKAYHYANLWDAIDYGWNVEAPLDFELLTSNRWGRLQRITAERLFAQLYPELAASGITSYEALYAKQLQGGTGD